MRPWSSHDGSALRGFLRLLRRRKLAIIPVLLILPAAAYFLTAEQEEQYEAQAEVLLGRGNLANSLTGTPDPAFTIVDDDRIPRTQARIASTPEVAQRVLDAQNLRDRSADELLADVSIEASPDTDILTFSVTDPDPKLAERLATEYATQFTFFRRELDTAAISRATREVTARLDQLSRQGQENSALFANLLDKQQQLETLETLQTANATLARRADNAAKVAPRPVRNAVIAGVLALLVGLGLAFMWEALDTRVRSAEEVSDALGLPLLARLPGPSRRLGANNKLAMLEEPSGRDAEVFRILRTNFEFVNLQSAGPLGVGSGASAVGSRRRQQTRRRNAQSIMVTSALEGEGKSTTVANLAVALARTGNHVILADLDLRRPYLARFFDLKDRQGLTDVALGHAALDDALAAVDIPPMRPKPSSETADGVGSPEGVLEVLSSGPIPPDAGEFIGSSAVAEVFASLRERCDLILVDAAPMLHIGDAMILSGVVDATVVVARLNVVRRPMLRELRRLLDRSPAHPLGFVAAGADRDEGYGYEAYGYEAPRDVQREDSFADVSAR